MERIFNFSIKRLAEVLRWEVACNGRMYVRAALALSVAVFIMFMFASGNVDGRFVVLTDDGGMDRKAGFAANVFQLAVMAGAFWGSFTLRNRQRRMAFLMLPATRFEKFAAWLIEITVGMMLIALAAIVIADALHLVCSLAIGSNGGLRSVTAAFMEAQFGRVPAFTVATAKGSFSFTISSIYMATMSVWLQSLFMAGFTLRSRLRLLFIALVAFGGVVLGSVLFTMQFAGPARDTSASFAIAVFSALIVINYLITYRWFGRLQLAEQKHGKK